MKTVNQTCGTYQSEMGKTTRQICPFYTPITVYSNGPLSTRRKTIVDRSPANNPQMSDVRFDSSLTLLL